MTVSTSLKQEKLEQVRDRWMSGIPFLLICHPLISESQKLTKPDSIMKGDSL